MSQCLSDLNRNHMVDNDDPLNLLAQYGQLL